jgi:hypothetical protein
MPNHVTNIIEFDSSKAEEIFGAVCPAGEFDFNILIPQPAHIYKGNTSSEDEQDFPVNWHSWNNQNWGTKWNAYSCSIAIVNGKAFIKFQTAWSPPYPVISAFANKFQVPFTHRYMDEAHNFWGVENWGTDERFTSEPFHRLSKFRDRPEDEMILALELLEEDMSKPETDES